ncbi:hypothetical protein M409DRAFT_17903 [Zasmidium cellare ATCC 36951]|uniref:Uncharacterized protein n=1 Tax=Zasmidium cellare ATCC 36951 TaxID=1080233 RepID=A0A6A6D217_ZASCE|nr:uncharacterized protein M409DRAFT_17903 [Zasmidium cellare ATCC 36951]KAF2171666.1 hypothetical protein M409DRAFT_17903 [Zasmidium cellare ATCC 36951]
MRRLQINIPAPTGPTPNDLTLSGDLYEGNYKEWHARMMASLRLRKLNVFLAPGLWFTDIGRRTTKEAADHICASISEATLKRLPDGVKQNCCRLMEVLEQFAAPFRFLDLPVEVRNRIYKMVLPGTYRVLEWERPVDELPALLQTCAVIRRETISMFYADTTFTIRSDTRSERYDFEAASEDMLRRWSKFVVAENARHLRTVHLWISEQCRVVFKFRKTLTLGFKGEQHIKGDTLLIEKTLARHVEAVEKISALLSIKGETILLALLMDWEMWWEMLDRLELEEDRESCDSGSDEDSEDWKWVP